MAGKQGLAAPDGAAFALGAVVVSGSITSGAALIFGAAYLAAAGAAGGLALLQLGPAIAARRRGVSGARVERAGLLGRIAVLAGWQFAVLGLFSIWSAGESRPPLLLALVLALVAASLAVADRMLALSDAPDEAGVRDPLRFLGVAGPRRLFFWVFVFPLSLPFLLGGARIFLSGPPYAPIFYPPRLSLAIVAFYDVAAAILVRQRFRKRRPMRRIGLAAIAIIVLAAMGLPFGLPWWLYILSAISAWAAAESARRLTAAVPPRRPRAA